MSLGACIYSSSAVSWQEFADFILSLKSTLPEVRIAIASTRHQVGMYREKEWALFVLLDQSTDPECLLEEMSRIRGTLQKTLIVADMNSYDLVRTVAEAFARKYPCLLDFAYVEELSSDISTSEESS